MKRLVLLAACLLLVAGCTGSAQDQLAAKDQQIAELQKQNTELKQELSRPPSCPNPSEVVSGQGDGHFTVMPAKLHPGEAVAVYTEATDGTVRLVRKDSGKEIASFPGPNATHITTYTLPWNLAPGAYLVLFSGHGGTSGEATITVQE